MTVFCFYKHDPKDTTSELKLRNAKNVSKNIFFINLAQNATGEYRSLVGVALDTCLLKHKPKADILSARPARVWYKSVYILSHKILLTIVPCLLLWKPTNLRE